MFTLKYYYRLFILYFHIQSKFKINNIKLKTRLYFTDYSNLLLYMFPIYTHFV